MIVLPIHSLLSDSSIVFLDRTVLVDYARVTCLLKSESQHDEVGKRDAGSSLGATSQRWVITCAWPIHASLLLIRRFMKCRYFLLSVATAAEARSKPGAPKHKSNTEKASLLEEPSWNIGWVPPVCLGTFRVMTHAIFPLPVVIVTRGTPIRWAMNTLLRVFAVRDVRVRRDKCFKQRFATSGHPRHSWNAGFFFCVSVELKQSWNI
jgi:hypothetical protein